MAQEARYPLMSIATITGMKKVFAGGDIVTGATTVIQAVASAREAVRNIGVLLGDKAGTV